jgi:hypothetical protein
MSFLCEYSKIKFCGECPNKNCVAWIGKRHESGCFHCLFPKQVTSDELEMVFTKEKIEESEQELKNLVAFFHWITQETPQKACINCGANIEGVLCTDEDMCDKRKFFAQYLLNKYPYNLLKIDKENIWFMCSVRNKIRERGLVFKDVMHLDKEEYRKLLSTYNGEDK